MDTEIVFFNLDNTRRLRDIFLRCLGISVIIMILMTLLFLLMKPWTLSVVMYFYPITQAAALNACLVLKGIMDILIILFFLVPALALQWQYSREKKFMKK